MAAVEEVAPGEGVTFAARAVGLSRATAYRRRGRGAPAARRA